MPAAISVPGANGAVGDTEVSGTERSLPSAAGFVQAVSSSAVGKPEEAGDATRAATEDRRRPAASR